ncbi:AAA family ATPase [Candidatus Mycolicibacterium alkanivorans]|uniref:MoxR family ATPase n=1 Tax=Candidatus Mycolicibacterium alkanivorans TaxID=2954114 RepID=A0ABS9YZ53_9MYCO|nr:MoxR family ATPase [Candidatus Mycolicibacterium alkanivorans]MCI4676358.1 MoxR family ATPase [Candidatus Mycolicibacterium alkanivorans]
MKAVGADPFCSVDDVVEALAEYGYIADRTLATTVFLVTRLDKPVLLEGPAGVGKTELAKALALATGRRLLRLQCYEGQDETKALYEWDYGKQLLYTQILREKIGQVIADADNLEEAVERIGAQESVFFSERFLAPRPLLEAIRSEQPVVLLIDEVDRADEALEAVLLEMLGEYQVSVPEIGTFVAAQPPYVVLTSNNTRDLAAALKRRCLHLFLDYPSAERELQIVKSKNTGLPDALSAQLVDIVRGLRGLELRKAPSISETIDWARTLAVLGAEELTAQTLAATISVVAKYEKDVHRALQVLPRLVDPNAAVPEMAEPHNHDHHDHHDHSHDDDVAGGKRVRAAKDQLGRFDDGYYGTPSTPPAGPSGRASGAEVSAAQASRSFARRRKF